MRPGFSIDTKGRHIFEVREVSRRFVGHLTEPQLRQLVQDKQPRLFLWAISDHLSEMPSDWLDTILPGQIVPSPDDIDIFATPNGCCYVAMLWKAEGGLPIIVLQQHH